MRLAALLATENLGPKILKSFANIIVLKTCTSQKNRILNLRIYLSH